MIEVTRVAELNIKVEVMSMSLAQAYIERYRKRYRKRYRGRYIERKGNKSETIYYYCKLQYFHFDQTDHRICTL